ncbi:MAG: TonB-dependent receptor [Flavobacteriales bacterium]|nr:TonB-dependent receptor [Flavobacteriales bacterium]
MAKFKGLTILLAVLFTMGVQAQRPTEKFSVYGQVFDNAGEPLPYVSVALFQTKDSTYAAGAASELNGKFSVSVKPGNYYAKVSFLSFKTKTIKGIVVSSADVNLKKIGLEPDVANLDEFEVVEEKKLMELDLDKKVYNVEKDATNQGADATEVLDNVPSVSVDVDGNVSLRGSENVRILINGKPSGLSGMSTANALKQLQGNQIEKIEVITNPSARYDAEGEVGIINIVLKRDKREGVNGTVNASLGYPNNYGAGFNVTFKRKNYSIFTGYGVSFRDSPGNASSSQIFTYPDTSFSYTSESQTKRFTFDNNFTLGTEIYFNDYNSLTVSGRYNIGDANNKVDLTYNDFNDLDIATQTVNRFEDEDKDLYSYDLSLNYRKTFKQKDRLFTFDIQQSQNVDNESSTITQTNNVIASENLKQSAFNNEGSVNWLFQTDYIHPIQKGKIEFGMKANLREVIDDYAVGEFNDSTQRYEAIPGFINEVVYNEKIYAAYLMYGKKLKRFSYQLGVRSEYSDIKTDLLGTNETNYRDYLNFFPSVHLNYELKKDHSFQVSYSKRIQRPRHWYMLPFFSYTDSRSNFSGNPNLNPEYTDAYEVGYLKNWDKGSFLTSVYYRFTTDVIERITFADVEGVTKRYPINLGIEDAYGVEFSGSQEINDWWNLRGSFNFYRSIREGLYDQVSYNSDALAWNTKLNSKWTIKKDYGFQASFNYQAPQQSPQGETLARYSLDLGLTFDCLKGNGTFTFNVKDLFNTRKRRSTSFGENFVSEDEHQWRSRYFRVNFTYRINQKKKRQRDRDYDDFDMDGM